MGMGWKAALAAAVLCSSTFIPRPAAAGESAAEKEAADIERAAAEEEAAVAAAETAALETAAETAVTTGAAKVRVPSLAETNPWSTTFGYDARGSRAGIQYKIRWDYD